MKSALKEMFERHRLEIKELRENCAHKNLKIRKDRSCVGAGSLFPSIHIVCRNCGKKKIIFRRKSEENVEVEKTLELQAGFKDQRLDCSTYDWELD